MCRSWKNRSHLKKCVTVEKMSHTLKKMCHSLKKGPHLINVSALEKRVPLKKFFHSLKKRVTLKKGVSQLKNGSLKRFSQLQLEKIVHTKTLCHIWKNGSYLTNCVTVGKIGVT